MENLKVLKNYKTDGEDIDEKLDYLMGCYEEILTQQEIHTIKMMSMEEVLNAMLENQKDMRNTLNKMMDKWGEK